MTNATESIIETSGRLPIPIAEMCVGFFWARHSSIFPNGGPISDFEIQARMKVAYDELVSAIPLSPGVS